jgi:hypothetical protein
VALPPSLSQVEAGSGALLSHSFRVLERWALLLIALTAQSVSQGQASATIRRGLDGTSPTSGGAAPGTLEALPEATRRHDRQTETEAESASVPRDANQAAL